MLSKISYTISIYGSFNISGSDGRLFRIRGEKERALVAVLCLSPGLRRSRKWLSSLLWGDGDDQRAASNLRQAIWHIRTVFSSCEPLLDADLDSVWIVPTTLVAIPPSQKGNIDLLEGFDICQEDFEDWLRENRAESASEFRSVARPVDERRNGLSFGGLPGIAIYPVIAYSQPEKICAELTMDVLIRTFVEQQCVQVFDLRDLDRLSLDPGPGSPSYALVPSMYRSGKSFRLSLSIRNLRTGRVAWSRWFDDCGPARSAYSEHYLNFRVGEIVNAVHDEIHRQSRSETSGNLFGAIQNVLSHTKEGQERARPWLVEAATESGLARAWLMYTFAVAHAERYGGLGKAALEELADHCHRANVAEPGNPIVQAIVGHINAFVFRDFETAEQHHAIARKLGWNHPIVWTLSAMHANYTSRPELAYSFSRVAMAQSPFSPNRFYFEGPHSISCSLTSRHDEAIVVSNSVLKRKPDFLAVMRHLAASQAILGLVTEARQTISAIRSKDPQYVRGDISQAHYPLPSRLSVDLIERGFGLTSM